MGPRGIRARSLVSSSPGARLAHFDRHAPYVHDAVRESVFRAFGERAGCADGGDGQIRGNLLAFTPLIVVALASGLLGDLVLAVLRPSSVRRWPLRLLAFAMPACS